jgi:stringent starvation protein B
MHEWMCDSGHTPHIVVDASAEDVEVPEDYIQDGRIVLNLGKTAVRSLDLGNDWVSFEARFSGRPWVVRIPVPAILGIYARETGEGMIFTETGEPEPPDGSGPDDSAEARRSHLKVVK